jgi:hypothetical protein
VPRHRQEDKDVTPPPEPAAGAEPADFLLLRPQGHATYERRRGGESVNQALRREIPDLASQGHGRLCIWFCDDFAGLPPNQLARQLLPRVGYRPYGWAGLVAITMDENSYTGDIPPPAAEVRAALDDVLAAVTGAAPSPTR